MRPRWAVDEAKEERRGEGHGAEPWLKYRRRSALLGIALGKVGQNYPVVGIERLKALRYLCTRTKTAWPLATRTDRRNIMK